uniref:Uncharacterized protein n=1 Tax=Setaria italica TaxID=4555 RepID=K3ZPP5_SETIT
MVTTEEYNNSMIHVLEGVYHSLYIWYFIFGECAMNECIGSNLVVTFRLLYNSRNSLGFYLSERFHFLKKSS